MLDVHSNTPENREHWRNIMVMAGIELYRRRQFEDARSRFAHDIAQWADRVPQYYAGSFEVVEGLIESLAMLRASLNAELVDSGVWEERDLSLSPDSDNQECLSEDPEDSYLLRNIGDLEILASNVESAREINAFLDGMEDALKSFQDKLRARIAAEPVFIDWLLAQRQSVLDAPDSLEDHRLVLQYLADTMQSVDDAVKDFEIVKHNVMPAVRRSFIDLQGV